MNWDGSVEISDSGSGSGRGKTWLGVLWLPLLLVVGGPAWGQGSSFEQVPRILRGLEIPDPLLSPEDLFRACGLAVGRPFTRPLLRQCIHHLIQTGRYRDVQVLGIPRPDGWVLRFVLPEIQRLGKVRIQGPGWWLRRRLLRSAGVESGMPYREDLVEEIRRRLMSWLEARGYLQARVQVRPRIQGETRVDLEVAVQPGPRARVARVTILAPEGVPVEQALQHFQTQEGAFFRQSLLEEDLRRLEDWLLRKGYVEARVGRPRLQPQAGGREVVIRIPLTPGPRLEVVWEGGHTLPRKVLEEVLPFREERSLDPLVVEVAVHRLMRRYQEAGYPFVQVEAATEVRTAQQVRIRFRIREGTPARIQAITFQGYQAFSESVLRSHLPLQEGDVFLSERVAEARSALEAFYREQGFARVQIQPRVEQDPKQGLLRIHFQIQEGPRIFVGRIRFQGNRHLPEAVLRAILPFQEGDPYREDLVRRGREDLEIRYTREGYLYVQVDLETRFSFDQRYALLTYRIQEGPVVRIGRIDIRGNRITRSWVLARALDLRPGDPFNLEQILLNQVRLRRMGFLADVRIRPFRPEVKEPVKDLVVEVQEGYPGSVEFGVGYGDVERFRGLFQISHRNLFGTARQLTLRMEGSSIERRYTLGYQQPWFLGTRFDTRAHLADLVEKLPSFTRRSFGALAGVERSMGRHLELSLFYQYEDVRLSNVAPEAVFTPEDVGKVRVATVNASLVWDTRDDPFNPARGSLLSASYREGARILGGRPQFVKVILQASVYRRVHPRVVLGASWRQGQALRFGETPEVPIFERFFAGGRSSVRGYAQDRLGIPGKTLLLQGQTWVPTGGNFMMVVNLEARIALPRRWGLVLFVDGGNIWDRIRAFDPTEMRFTAGGGIRYNTPVGPLRLDVGCKMDREPFEESCLFHFTLGHAF